MILLYMDSINGIPVYDFTIDMLDEEVGVSVISLVDKPAVEKSFIALNEHKKINLSIDTDRHIVTGVALRADFPIYRYNDNTKQEYYFRISPQQIELMMQKFMSEKRVDKVNLQHDGNEQVDGVYLWESYQLTDKHKIGYPEFQDIESGSWMVSYKINNEKVWNDIKTGKLTGFSPEIFGELSDSRGVSADLSIDESIMASYLLTLIENI